MQRSASSAPAVQGTIPFFSTNIWGTSSKSDSNTQGSAPGASANSSNSKSRPGTSSGDQSKDHSRRPSFGRKSSISSPSKGKRRASSSASNGGGSGGQIITDATAPPALPDYALAAAAKVARDPDAVLSPTSVDSFSKMISRTMSAPSGGIQQTMSGASGANLSPQSSIPMIPTESPSLYSHIQDLANKRISTLDYLRKAHEGRIYWFNTLLFDKPDLARMPYFDSRKLARRATNYLLLGLSIPVVIDLNSSTPLEFLRSLNTLLNEFDSYQQIHTENGVSSSSLSRARLPHMFRRPGGKGRRQSGAASIDYADPNAASFNKDGSAVNAAPASVINFGLGGEGNDLVAGEEYTHLLTPNLPFDPDFFETFATLCDVLIDCYSRLMSLLTGPKDCTPLILELFTKADSRVRKIIIQGVVKEFEDSSRTGLKQEVANVGKVVLGGLM
ncbi:hypothetical protein F5B22DRAFT_31336 [Xylaria bambusicola]|uniref:uncharacterized protein n=1 Tax=Xylaria bambusicola TaxID=326684 RepID=UPI0020084C92|nr:uncharacterized protein F5B22DRAFT_31336 [Xylaria bambusicola]KAI0528324.1 hypothetical protein F5B22DRAFT_31336 [Xylaria bambusicola]